MFIRLNSFENNCILENDGYMCNLPKLGLAGAASTDRTTRVCASGAAVSLRLCNAACLVGTRFMWGGVIHRNEDTLQLTL